jgi:ribosome recycling factor
MINEIFIDTKDRMHKAVEHSRHEVATIRTGQASTSIVDGVKVDYYGTMSPLGNIANISAPEAQLVVIQPFDPSSLDAIEKAIISSDIGLHPNNDGNVIRLNVPTLTDERRKELVRVVHKIIEEGRVAVRNIRRDANDHLKKIEKEHEMSEDNLKRALDNIQETTDNHIKELNGIQEMKEKEILI